MLTTASTLTYEHKQTSFVSPARSLKFSHAEKVMILYNVDLGYNKGNETLYLDAMSPSRLGDLEISLLRTPQGAQCTVKLAD